MSGVSNYEEQRGIFSPENAAPVAAGTPLGGALGGAANFNLYLGIFNPANAPPVAAAPVGTGPVPDPGAGLGPAEEPAQEAATA